MIPRQINDTLMFIIKALFIDGIQYSNKHRKIDEVMTSLIRATINYSSMKKTPTNKPKTCLIIRFVIRFHNTFLFFFCFVVVDTPSTLIILLHLTISVLDFHQNVGVGNAKLMIFEMKTKNKVLCSVFCVRIGNMRKQYETET